MKNYVSYHLTRMFIGSNLAKMFWLIIYAVVLTTNGIIAQSLNPNHIPTDAEIFNALSDSYQELQEVKALFVQGYRDSAKCALTRYYKMKSGDRYYFDWKKFTDRFREYQAIYPDAGITHYQQTQYQMDHFGAETCWQLPFYDLTGEKVTAYQLRHLARQQKSADMALVYYYENEDRRYLDYFVRQVADLNRAFTAGEYDDAGNGIYERFRAGKRVHNWLFAHQVYLASDNYSWQSQYLLIKTFLHHGAQLEHRTKNYSTGNHHTKGLVALFEIATMFPEFVDSECWRKQAVEGLLEHMSREINSDGFQFERSIHYHKGDIENYLRVYQLAKINGIQLPQNYIDKFRQLFSALVCLARPDRRLPVLQDDTDRPLADFNDLDDVLTVGTILFQDPVYKYFAAKNVRSDLYWLFQEEQLNNLSGVCTQMPTIGTCVLPETGYYIMRNGWELQDCHMVISAGLSKEKPDHQHADMLGIVAYANGHTILPNYQVKYNYPDLYIFKNSWVKNVTLVDSVPQGREWIPNQGGSGFGKWLHLPEPDVLAWISKEGFDYFAGTHNGYADIGVEYIREVLFIKDGYWIVVDRFESEEDHQYQQLWQGDYSIINDQEIQSVFHDGSGLIIKQLSTNEYEVRSGQNRDKKNTIFSINKTKDFSFITLLIPYTRSNLGNMGKKFQVFEEGEEDIFRMKHFTINARLVLLGESGMVIGYDVDGLFFRAGSMEFTEPVSTVITSDRGKYQIDVFHFRHYEVALTDLIECVDHSDNRIWQRYIVKK